MNDLFFPNGQYNWRAMKYLDVAHAFEHKNPTQGCTGYIKEVMLYIYPIMVNELVTDIPIRKNYLLYLIEEWFEDTKLDEIQQGFNRNDLSLDYVTVFQSNNKGDICVPPPPKPEGVTMQEMMDHIKKNTLYSYKEMEKKEKGSQESRS